MLPPYLSRRMAHAGGQVNHGTPDLGRYRRWTRT